MTTYLKVIGPDNRACHGGAFDYTKYLPQGDEPGAWLPEREPVLCKSGWHWCTPESLMGKWAVANMRVYEAEPSADVTVPSNDGKCVSRSGRLLRPYPLPDWWNDAMHFIREDFPAIPWMQRVGPVDPAWRLFPSRTAARDAVVDAARDAARDAVWGAVWGAAGDAARDAAGDAVWGAAGDAAGDAVEDAAGDAVVDAVLVAITRYVCADLPIGQQHRDHAAARWEVWRRGYGVLCDVDGVLYVYEAVQ